MSWDRSKREVRSAFSAYFIGNVADSALPPCVRRLRLGARVTALLALLLCALTVVHPAWLRFGNLALHRPAISSGAEFGTHPGDAVDGTRYGELGFHSTVNDPRLTIDLEAPAILSRIDVYGRADCCFEQSVPLSIATSLNGRDFKDLATLTTAFSQEDPWSLQVSPPVSARYVRLATLRQSPLVVGEIEVFGSRR